LGEEGLGGLELVGGDEDFDASWGFGAEAGGEAADHAGVDAGVLEACEEEGGEHFVGAVVRRIGSAAWVKVAQDIKIQGKCDISS
jgi:hypothetical protein